MHRDQHSSIQMDGLEDDTIAAGDTHYSDQSLSSSGCRPHARLTSAPPRQRCPARQRIRVWQRRGAARRSRPSGWEQCALKAYEPRFGARYARLPCYEQNGCT